MASFNLGRIKGDSGAKGDTGAQGAAGQKGDRGEQGTRGIDGRTPVFSVGKTLTLPSYQEAYVEIDASDPYNPVLSFSIPRGSDGADALGDMLSSVYDTGGVKKDIYTYADTLFSKCVKLNGGQLTGALKAAETAIEEGYVRNISIRTTLPESAANGDVCIIIKGKNEKTLGECPVGTVLLTEEAGVETEYLLIATNYYRDNTATFIRKRLAPNKQYFDVKSRENYVSSDIDIVLETIYPNLFPEEVRSNLVPVSLDGIMRRRCFILSHTELANFPYFTSANSRIALMDNGVSEGTYLTRSVTSSRIVYNVKETGLFSTIEQITPSYYRPAFVLPSDMVVVNDSYKSSPVVKLTSQKNRVYVYVDGDWKECG